MIRRDPPLRALARLSLVLAALLHFAGAAGGPWAHTHGRELASDATVCAPDRHGTHAPARHDELACGVWQALGSVGTLAAGAEPAAAPAVHPRTDDALPAGAPAPLRSAPSARAPPHA